MAKLYLLGTLALIFAVFVAARNTYEKDDADVDEVINALVRALKGSLTRQDMSNETNAMNDDAMDDNDLESDSAEESKEKSCSDRCNTDIVEELCKCAVKECVPLNCVLVRETDDEDTDDNLDNLDASKRWFRLRWGRPKRRRVRRFSWPRKRFRKG